MLVRHRPFDEQQDDFRKMWDFIRQDFAHRGDQFIWLFSRLGDWKYGLWRENKYVPTFFRDHAHLWLGGLDELLGFVLSEDGDQIFFIFTRPGFEYLYDEILEWTVQNWGARYPSLITEVHEHQPDSLERLERHGFHSNGAVALTRRYDLRALRDDTIRLPEGYRIESMSEHWDERGKALLLLNGFQRRDEVTELDLLKFAYARESPAYDPGCDLSVVNAEGVHVATCTGFNDPAYRVAEVERVCTQSQFRQLGLAEAVIRTCFQRLRARGIETAYITGYSTAANALYEKLGPCDRRQWLHYELKP